MLMVDASYREDDRLFSVGMVALDRDFHVLAAACKLIPPLGSVTGAELATMREGLAWYGTWS